MGVFLQYYPLAVLLARQDRLLWDDEFFPSTEATCTITGGANFNVLTCLGICRKTRKVPKSICSLIVAVYSPLYSSSWVPDLSFDLEISDVAI